MPPQAQIAAKPAIELAGDPLPLLERLGYFSGATALPVPDEALATAPIKTVAELQAFLRQYHTTILRPIELPAIRRAFEHAGRQECRELLALDSQLTAQPELQRFADASRRAGLAQLERLRPLRDERLVRRYRDAVEERSAHGWHTLVFGISLAIYSMPLRQGLHGYAQMTTRGFIDAASRSLEISATDARVLTSELCSDLSASVEPLVVLAVS
jgi:urease accessory protein UreF